MKLLLFSLKQRLPSSWSIIASPSGTIDIHDPSAEKAKGYNVKVLESFNSYRAIVQFGDFAMKLSTHAQNQLLDTDNTIRRIFDAKRNIKLKRFKTTIEDALNSSEVYSDGWWLELEFKKIDTGENENSFSDLLLSLLLFLLPYDVDIEEEGAKWDSTTTKYERSHLNRSLCLAYHGYTCKACGLNLEQKYGNVARNFIHVHHVNPISVSGVIKPNPIFDLVPLCPNCHGIAHLKDPSYSIEDIKNMIIKNNGSLLA
jgi:hypothetical protein